jgi:hypothetical protein
VVWCVRPGSRLALAVVAWLALIVLLAFIAPNAAVVALMIGVVPLCFALSVGIIVVATRQPKPGRTDFGGRYSSFGLVLAWINRAPNRRRDDRRG